MSVHQPGGSCHPPPQDCQPWSAWEGVGVGVKKTGVGLDEEVSVAQIGGEMGDSMVGPRVDPAAAVGELSRMASSDKKIFLIVTSVSCVTELSQLPSLSLPPQIGIVDSMHCPAVRCAATVGGK
jgi:hypothetical protein